MILRRLEILGYTPLQILGLADIDHHPILVKKAVNTRSIRQSSQFVLQFHIAYLNINPCKYTKQFQVAAHLPFQHTPFGKHVIKTYICRPIKLRHVKKTRLINIADFKKAIKIKGPVGTLIAAPLMYTMGLHKINSHYQDLKPYYNAEFTRRLIENFRINCNINQEELANIPKEGPFIITSNHPFGGIDGIVLYNTISSIRPDFKILTNFLLSYIDNLKECFMPVNPFSDRKDLKSSLAGIRAAMEHVRNGGALGLFPSGEVSTYYGNKFTRDREWQPAMIKLIKNSGVPVVPIYFHGTNSRWFHTVGRIHPLLRTMRLPNELNNKVGSTITMRIGKPILFSEIRRFEDNSILAAYLRSRSYALEALVRMDEAEKKAEKAEIKFPGIAPAKEPSLMAAEIEKHGEKAKLYEFSKYQGFLFESDDIPELMYELGRQREMSFRSVGEGTNRALDIDKYDQYYKQLIIWDKEAEKIVGAYRLGIGEEIIRTHGPEGFYSTTLFRYNPNLKGRVNETIELGRSFVSRDYSREPICLFLLFKGLLFSMMRYPSCKYLIGPVSISSSIDIFYRSLIIQYIEKFFSPEKEYCASAIHPVPKDFLRCETDALLAYRDGNIDQFDRYISQISNGHFRIPTLIKKYIKLNGHFHAFNVDPDFNYCVDGLVEVKITDIPKEELLSLMKGSDEKEQAGILERFGKKD